MILPPVVELDSSALTPRLVEGPAHFEVSPKLGIVETELVELKPDANELLSALDLRNCHDAASETGYLQRNGAAARYQDV